MQVKLHESASTLLRPTPKDWELEALRLAILAPKTYGMYTSGNGFDGCKGLAALGYITAAQSGCFLSGDAANAGVALMRACKRINDSVTTVEKGE